MKHKKTKMPPQGHENFELSQLQERQNHLPDILSLNFESNLENKKAGDFDIVTWNLFRILIQANLKKGYRGKEVWLKAHVDAAHIRDDLKSIPEINASGDELHFSVFDNLLALAKKSHFSRIELSPNLDVKFFGQKNSVEYQLNLISVRKEKVLHTTREQETGLFQEVVTGIPGLASRASEKLQHVVESVGLLPKDRFSPIVPPKISNSRPERMISAVDTMRQTGKAPRIIDERFRSFDVCSAYALQLMEQVYGRDAIIDSGLVSYGKMADAWNIKSTGLARGSIDVVASVADQSVDKKNHAEHTLRIKDQKKYAAAVSTFFDTIRDGHYPAFLTAFQTNTKFAKKIWEENSRKPDDLKSYNSHVLVALGPGPIHSEEVPKGTHYLSHFIEKQSRVSAPFQRYLKIQVQKAGGEVLEMSEHEKAAVRKFPDGRTEKIPMNMVRFRLNEGDRVLWQDVLVSDFYKGSERVMGLGEFASQKQVILMDLMTLKAQPRNHSDYHPVDFLQVSEGQNVRSQIQQKLGLNGEDMEYYLAALADSGFDFNSVRSRDLVPVFDIGIVRKTIDQKGGPKSLLLSIQKANAEKIGKEHLNDILIFIEGGKSPWSHVEGLFRDYFPQPYTLSASEKSLILEAIDQSCPSMNLKSNPVHFEAGDVLYLTKQRIYDIALLIRQKQTEAFRSDDYVKIVEASDDPLHFLASAFDEEAASSPEKIRYVDLNGFEKEYLLKAFCSCNKEVDLNYVGEGTQRRWKNFSVGARMVLRKVDLQHCIETILDRRSYLKSNERFRGPMVNVVQGVEFRTDVRVIPEDVRLYIDHLYPGRNLGEAVVRNALYFVYAKEQLGGGGRRFKKEMADKYVPFYHLKSVGAFQLRPTQVDMKICAEVFSQRGIQMPARFEDFEKLVASNTEAATIVAGQRLMEAYNEFQTFMDLNGENAVERLDRNFAIMLVTSYNRSPRSVFRSVFQNWASKIAEASGVQSDVGTLEIDALGGSGKRQQLEQHVVSTFKRVAEKLQQDGVLHFQGDVDSELMMMFQNSSKFLQSPLFREMKEWYESSTKQKLQFVFADPELQRGDHIFSYGRRYLADDFGRLGSNWNMAFANFEGLKSSFQEMSSEYKSQPFEQEKVDLPLPVLVPEKKLDVQEDVMHLSGMDECFEEGQNILTVYAKQVSIREKPQGDRVGMAYFGSHLEVLGVEKKSGEVWAHVKVISGPLGEKEGYIAFEKEWYSNEHGSKLPPGLVKKLDAVKTQLPPDYERVMKGYVRFLDNYNPAEAARSASIMENSRPAVLEVKSLETVEKVLNVARSVGYVDQRLFGFVTKIPLAGLKKQRFFLIDTEKKRVLSFTVSTGRPGSETPSGLYTAYSHGFKDVNYFGADMGHYAEKYKHMPKRTAFVAGPGSGNISMTTALIEVRGESDKRSGSGRYFHGTNRENHLGEKASSGCIRMSNLDAVYLASVLNGAQMNFQILDSVNLKDVKRSKDVSVWGP